MLEDTGLAEGAFILACVLVLVVVVTQGLSRVPGVVEIAMALGVAVVYGLVFVRMTIPAERSHLVEFGIVAVLVYEALKERASAGRPVPAPAVLAATLTAAAGVVDELLQGLMPSRVFDTTDMVFNTLAACMAVGGSALLSWARSLAAGRPGPG